MPLEQKKNNSQKNVRYQRCFFIPYWEFGQYKITRLIGFFFTSNPKLNGQWKSEAEKKRDYPDSAAKVH